MNPPSFRIESLPAMQVASVHVISATPERDAWRRLEAWATARGLLGEVATHPVYGFNRPGPTAAGREYGYEFWIAVERDTYAPDDGVELKEFPGGLYAVVTCRLLNDPAGDIGRVWNRLWTSVQSSAYCWRHTHELEHPHDPCAVEADMVLDLYLPIEPRPNSPADAAAAPVTPGP